MNHQREDEDNRYHFVSPISASSPEYGNFYGGFPPAHNPPEVNGRSPHDYSLPQVNGGFPHDDGLPEVRVDNSPQALSNLEAEYKWRHFEEREPKYPVVYDDSLKTVIPAQLSLQYESTAAAEQTPDITEPLPPQENRIFGLKRKIFFLVLAILIILIIAAGVGGGVGGSASHSKSNTPVLVVVDNVTVTSLSSSSVTMSSIASKTTLSSSSSTITTTTTTATSATPSPTISFLNNQTTPTTTFSFQGFSKFDYEGNATSIIHAEGGTNFAFGINSYVWLPNTTSCCLSFCVNATTQGGNDWWCDERYQTNASAPFDRVFVWCGEARTDANAVCA